MASPRFTLNGVNGRETMTGIQDLTGRYGLSDKAVRRRLDALSPFIAPYTTRGENNSILLTDNGLTIFDRLVQVERETKRSLTAAIEAIGNELNNGGKPFHQTVSKVEAHGGESPLVIEVLRDQIEELKKDKQTLAQERDRLLSLLESKEEQILALMPGRSPVTAEVAAQEQPRQNGNPKPSRWRAFMYLLWGK